MARWRALSRHPDRSSSPASQSRSSGWLGRPPLRPKSLGVATSPRPKWYCHTRLAITRAGRGLAGAEIQAANRLRRSASGASGISPRSASTAVMAESPAGVMIAPGDVTLPRRRRAVGAGSMRTPTYDTSVAAADASVSFVSSSIRAVARAWLIRSASSRQARISSFGIAKPPARKAAATSSSPRALAWRPAWRISPSRKPLPAPWCRSPMRTVAAPFSNVRSAAAGTYGAA